MVSKNMCEGGGVSKPYPSRKYDCVYSCKVADIWVGKQGVWETRIRTGSQNGAEHVQPETPGFQSIMSKPEQSMSRHERA
jgi:hypothetical protein